MASKQFDHPKLLQSSQFYTTVKSIDCSPNFGIKSEVDDVLKQTQDVKINELMIISRDNRDIHSSIADLTNNVIKWKHFPCSWLRHQMEAFSRYWPFVQGIHRSPVNSPHKNPWRGALMFSLICTWINGWAINREAGDLRRYRTHYDVHVMYWPFVLGIHHSLVNSQCKCQWHEDLMFSLICTWINGWVNNREAGDLSHHRAQCDVTVMILFLTVSLYQNQLITIFSNILL